MPTSSTLTPDAPFALRQPNVSQPSIVHSKPSQQSITATEDYYSLSNSASSTTSGDSAGTAREAGVGGPNVIHRFVTPPERCRTPAQSRDYLPQAGAGTGGNQTVGSRDAIRGEEEEAEARTTPIRGPGVRRDSVEQTSVIAIPAAVPLRGNGAQRISIPRRPVPTKNSPTTSPASAQTAFKQDTGMIDPTNARSSVAIDLDNDPEGVLAQRGRDGAITPGVDDGPYVRFALDQLTRDEEVRGSRGYGSYAMPGAFPSDTRKLELVELSAQRSVVELSAVEPGQAYGTPTPVRPSHERFRAADDADDISRLAPAAAAGAGAAAVRNEYDHGRYTNDDRSEPTRGQWQAEVPDEPPARNPNRPISRTEEAVPIPQERSPRRVTLNRPLQGQSSNGVAVATIQQQQQRDGEASHGGDAFIPVTDASRRLTFVPGILRPVQLGLFLFAVLAYVVCLIVCAGWSLTHQGLWAYGAFGDVRYFVFQYLPILLGVILFFWTVQIEVALYRIAPFAAMSSNSPEDREVGRELPLVPKGLVLPYIGHFKAPGLKIIGLFLLVAWLQIWTVPLLASSFNVHYFGSQALRTGGWTWIATQGPIWTCIILYMLLAAAVVLLAIWLKFGRRETGLLWDPRSLADLVVLLARSNALDNGEYHAEPAQLGLWRTAGRPRDIFHTYGVAEKPGRQYSLRDGEIKETTARQEAVHMPATRYSIEPEMHGAIDADDEQRHSREKMLPRDHGDYDEERQDRRHIGGARLIPWFLQPIFSSLWAIVALVLLLAFLIVSYLPSTGLARGFHPDVPTAVNRAGFSGANFLYSFVPALLGMLCLLFWLDTDYAWRRLQIYQALSRTDGGAVAERSLLLSYAADFPGFVTAGAIVNRHWRVAVLSLVSLIAAALPILGGGVFWAQFYVSAQRTKISIHPPAYYALTVFAVLYALAYFLIFPGRQLREASHRLQGNSGMTFAEVSDLVQQSRMVDDFAFHAPASKIALITRLLSATPGAGAGVLGVRQTEAADSRASLADSIRGFGRARQQATGAGGAQDEKSGVEEVGRYALWDYDGRDGGSYYGIDRIQRRVVGFRGI